MDASTRLSTTRGRRSRLRTVCELTLMPSIAVRPTHQAEDIGAMLVDPSSLSELISTTGVPKYSIFGFSSRFTGPPRPMSSNRRRSSPYRRECDARHIIGSTEPVIGHHRSFTAHRYVRDHAVDDSDPPRGGRAAQG